MNGIAASMLLNMTSSMRFDGSLNVDLNDITMNLVPYPQVGWGKNGVDLPRPQPNSLPACLLASGTRQLAAG